MTENAVTQTGGTLQQTKAYKFFTYLLGAALVLIWSAITDGITQAEWTTIILGVATAIVVWLTSNLPHQSRLKEIAAAVMTAANILVAYLFGDGFNGQDVVNLIILVLTVLGVIAVPNPVASTGTPPRGLSK